MRMWNVNPKFLCLNHLLGEHLECHMFLGCLEKGTSVQGYLDNGLLEIHHVRKRHDELASEMKSRGMNHNSPINETQFDCRIEGCIDCNENIQELKRRCPKCRERIEKYDDI